MAEKRFQLITWVIEGAENEIPKSVQIQSEIYKDADAVIQACDGKNIAIAIGLNPSNTTVFNDDVTNLYLRDKIYDKWHRNGYILTNLSATIESDSGKITLDDFEKKHIEDVVKLIEQFSNSEIVVFFGQTGVDFLNNKTKYKQCFGDLKKSLLKNKSRVFYTRSTPKFIHPGRSGQDYEFAPIEDNTLDKK